MSSQFPHREAARAPFDEAGWNQLQRDVDKLYRVLQVMAIDEDNISTTATPTVAGLKVDHIQERTTGHGIVCDHDVTVPNLITAGLVDGVDVSGHAARHNSGGADALAAGTTTAKGLVELATDCENAASVAVQGNDSRLGWSRFAILAQNNAMLWGFFLGGST